jgi:hypothetical protein
MPDDRTMEMFVVYQRPRDFPNHFVMRRWTATAGKAEPDQDYFILGETLDQVRQSVPRNCVRLERDPNDDPVIVEIWL